MYSELRNQVVLITGASRGIGLGIAEIFANWGSKLVLTEIEERFKELQNTAKQLSEKLNVDIKTISLDITNIDEIRKKISTLEEPFNKVTILVNNAGINIIKDSLEMSEDEWDEVSSINLKGTFFVTQEIAKIMISNNIEGSIINIASQHGVVGNLNRSAYCATKAGLINLTKALSYEWAKYGIRVNSVSPTYVETDNNREYLNSSKSKREYLNKIPMRKYAVPKDVGNACVFLGTSNARLITGHNLIIDGGYTSI